MAVNRRKDTGKWQIDRVIDGKRYRVTIIEAQNKTEALAAEKAWLRRQFERKYSTTPKRKKFIDFVNDVFLPYSKTNKRSYIDDVYMCKVFCQFFKGYYLDEITPQLIEDYKRWRVEGITRNGTRRSPGRVNRELNSLSRIFSLAVDNELLSINPARKKRFKLDDERKRFLSVDEEYRLMKALEANERTQLIVIMALYTGMRRGEIFNLRWRDVDFDRELIHVKNTKTAKDRSIPITPRVHNVLVILKQKSNHNDFVFYRTKDTTKRDARSENSLSIDRAFKKALKEAGINDFRFHDLRHSAGTRLADAGTPMIVIADILGHRDLRTTKRYTHPTDPARREAMLMLNEYSKYMK